jgi:hypothetical protein
MAPDEGEEQLRIRSNKLNGGSEARIITIYDRVEVGR